MIPPKENGEARDRTAFSLFSACRDQVRLPHWPRSVALKVYFQSAFEFCLDSGVMLGWLANLILLDDGSWFM